MRRMEILGLSESTPKTESRVKSLFWPSIQSGADVDYLGSQGYWVCTISAVLSLVVVVAGGHPITAFFVFLYLFLGGVGVRERSFFAAAIVFIFYILETIFGNIGVVRILITALLFSNMRATWLASQWKPESDEAVLPPRFNETLMDKFADKLPSVLWPKIRYVYYVYSVGFLIVEVIGLAMLTSARLRH
jgi:hypothetical protein